MKLKLVRIRREFQVRYSAAARSREMERNSVSEGWVCMRRQKVDTATPAEQRKAERKALNGKEPTIAMYTACTNAEAADARATQSSAMIDLGVLLLYCSTAVSPT
jgi:hypothetical protein